MIPWVHLDTTTVPGGGELRLSRRGDEFSIMAGPIELMNSRRSGSENALATLSCARVGARRKAHLLIGGLGMGFTLRQAQAELRPDARITVAELVPAVIAWANGPLSELYGDSLKDPRVEVVEADVGGLIREGVEAYDAILLDVDNGPDGLSRRGNDRLYDREGLAATRRALRPGGVLAVWSAAPDAAFVRRLPGASFTVEEVPVRAHGTRGRAQHVIWLAVKPGTSPATVAR